ncbi:hypothetical protein D3C86_2167840 [compost metagenome]
MSFKRSLPSFSSFSPIRMTNRIPLDEADASDFLNFLPLVSILVRIPFVRNIAVVLSTSGTVSPIGITATKALGN